MQPDPDELAGVADLFGALTRAELRSAFRDLAARSGSGFDPDEFDAAVDEALEGYYLVAVEDVEVEEADDGFGDGGENDDGSGSGDGSGSVDASGSVDGDGVDEGAGAGDRELLAGGPTALPRLPEGGEDLPHLVDVDHRAVDRQALGDAAHARLRGDAARAVDAGDEERIATLLDVCYDLESWAPVETAELREQLDDAP